MNRLYILLISSLISFLGYAQPFNQGPGSGNCLRFGTSGTTDRVVCPDASSLSFASTMTIEAWFKTSQSNIAPRIIGKETIGSIWPEYVLMMNANGTLRYALGNGVPGVVVYLDGTVAHNDDEWHHVAVTYNGAMMRMYVDGVLEVSTTTSIAMWNSTSPVMIGSGGNGPTSASYFWDGFLDEVRLWNTALNLTQIQANMCQSLADCSHPNLVGYWRLDEGTDNTCIGGQDVCDASCNGNHGTKF